MAHYLPCPERFAVKNRCNGTVRPEWTTISMDSMAERVKGPGHCIYAPTDWNRLGFWYRAPGLALASHSDPWPPPWPITCLALKGLP